MNSKKIILVFTTFIFLFSCVLKIDLCFAKDGPYIDLKGIKLIENENVSKDMTTGISDIPVNSAFKINFSNGVYRVKEHDLKHIYLYNLENNEKVPVNLQVVAPGTYGDFFEEKEELCEGNINKSRSIVMTPIDSLKEGSKYRIFIDKEVKANNTLHLKDDIKIDFTCVAEVKESDVSSNEVENIEPEEKSEELTPTIENDKIENLNNSTKNVESEKQQHTDVTENSKKLSNDENIKKDIQKQTKKSGFTITPILILVILLGSISLIIKR